MTCIGSRFTRGCAPSRPRNPVAVSGHLRPHWTTALAKPGARWGSSGSDGQAVTRTPLRLWTWPGAVDDAESVARYLSHDRPRVRAEVVRAVRRLRGTLSPIAEMLNDPAPVVVRACVDAMLGQPSLVAIDRLWDLLAADQPAHVRRAAFRLLVARGTWTRIEADLRLVGDRDALLAGNARSNLIGWLDHDTSPGYQMPSQSTRERLSGLIDGIEADIGARNAHLLRWHLGLSH
ncbi:MAG TPA: HEAT repeat domain-containing protein [Mycobacterium sp.]|nr:HEAT repeat domain-containing protein [Mycobacterium sp.]